MLLIGKAVLLIFSRRTRSVNPAATLSTLFVVSVMTDSHAIAVIRATTRLTKTVLIVQLKISFVWIATARGVQNALQDFLCQKVNAHRAR